MQNEQTRILILNWRSIKDPLVGGAEVATFEHAKRWVSMRKASVTWISPSYNQSTKSEVIEGINFQYISPHLDRNLLKLLYYYPLFILRVIFVYTLNYRGKVDVVIDEVHGLPYFTPFYVKEKIIVYIHEVANEIWDKMYPFPINIIGKLLEKIMFTPYKHQTFIAVSNNTKKDLSAIGISPSHIQVIYNGINLTPKAQEASVKEDKLTILYLNRVVPMKGIERAIDIFKLISDKDPNSSLTVAGHGEPIYIEELKKKCKELSLDHKITFLGYVSEAQKIQLLSNSSVLLNPSYKEGWGLVNIEANSQGTPVVGFNVPGITESIISEKTGYIVNTNEDAAEVIVHKLKNIQSQDCIDHALRYDWNRQSMEFFSKML